MFKCTIKRKASSQDIYSEIINSLPKAMEKVMIYAQNVALSHKTGRKDKNLITYKIVKNDNVIEGRLTTNFDYAGFLEFGTGKLSDGSMPHIGHTKTFHESGMTFWWIPPELSKDGDWHLVYTQLAKPFMRPTAFEMEKSAKDILAKEIIKAIRG